MQPPKSVAEHIEQTPAAEGSGAGADADTAMEKTVSSNLENDPHRAALEDNPDEPEKMTFMKGLAIFVSVLYCWEQSASPSQSQF